MNGTATHQLTIVYDASHRSYVEDKFSKNYLRPIWRPLKILPPKVEKPMYGTELYRTVVELSRRSARDICPRATIHILLIGGSPGGGATIPCYTFLESSHRANVMPHLTCNAATVFEIFAIEISDFGETWGSISTIIQKDILAFAGWKTANVDKWVLDNFCLKMPKFPKFIMSSGRLFQAFTFRHTN